MIIQHNLTAMNASRQLGITTKKSAKSTEKLSSGYRINKAADDAAGLAISEKMRGQIRGLNQASRNAEDGISLIQTAEGALQESQNIIQRMRELSVQAATDTNTNDDRTQIQQEINQLTQEVDRIATTTEFNTKKLINGEQTGSLNYRAGNASVEGSFQNGNVNIIPLGISDSSLVGLDDVIRIQMQRDISAMDKTDFTIGNLSECTPDGHHATLTTLNGRVSAASFTIEDGIITIANSKFEQKGVPTSEGAEVPNELQFKISGISNLKAGDIITISLTRMQSSKAAEPGKPGLRIQAGANAGQEVLLQINSMKAKDLGIVQISTSTSAGDTAGQALDVTTQDKASLAIEAYDKALQKVSGERANLGAIQNRLEHSIANLDTSAENLQASESRIRDVDMADEMTEFSKNNILMQAGQSMLAQANQSTQGILTLLQG